MKVSNLYLGDISEVTKIKEVPLDGSFKNLFGAFIFETSITYRIKRHTILLKTSDKNEEVKDIIYGGKYKIKKAGDCEIGEEFVPSLEQLKLLSAIQETSYTRNSITKRKLLKIVNEKGLLKDNK